MSISQRINASRFFQTGAQRALIHDSEAHDSAEGVAARHPGDFIFPLALHVPGDVVPACVEFSPVQKPLQELTRTVKDSGGSTKRVLDEL